MAKARKVYKFGDQLTTRLTEKSGVTDEVLDFLNADEHKSAASAISKAIKLWVRSEGSMNALKKQIESEQLRMDMAFDKRGTNRKARGPYKTGANAGKTESNTTAHPEAEESISKDPVRKTVQQETQSEVEKVRKEPIVSMSGGDPIVSDAEEALFGSSGTTKKRRRGMNNALNSIDRR